MSETEVLEQKKRVVQEQLECWSAVRKLIQQNVMIINAGGAMTLAHTQALEIAVNAEGRALEHIDAAYSKDYVIS